MDPSDSIRFTKRETFYLHNTLLSLVKALENRCTTIDLRNETCATGKITQVDGYMNVTLKDAALYDTDGEYQYFPMLYIQARNIRNVHIPTNVNVKKAIESQVMKSESKVVKNKMTFKQSRAKKQQRETLELIKQMKKDKTDSSASSSSSCSKKDTEN